MRRWVTAYFALFALTTLLFAARGYLYCHALEQAMPSCCCAGHDDESSGEELVDPCCCTWRGPMATATVVVTDVSSDELEIGSPTSAALPSVALVAPVRTVRSWIGAARLVAPVDARGPPPLRRGKARARLGVMLC